MRTPYTVNEHESIDLPLDTMLSNGRVDLYDDVIGKGYISAVLKGDEIRFTAGGYVGLIPINDRVAINVLPKVPLAQLTRILEISESKLVHSRRTQRKYRELQHQPAYLVDLLAAALVSEVDIVAHRGLHYEYASHYEDTSFPRGRVLMHRTVHHVARGATHIVGVHRFERNFDIPANRLLKYALWYLGQQYSALPRRGKQWRRTVTALNRLLRAFDKVPLDRSMRFLSARVVDETSLPAHRAYYENALRLARVIVASKGIELLPPEGDAALPSLLIKLDDTFESYVRAVLRDGFRDLQPHVLVLDGNVYPPIGARASLFDQATGNDATPDIVIQDAEGGVPIVCDVKYKGSGPDRGDINQAVTYAVRYNSPKVVLCHPRARNGRTGLSTLGRIGSITVYKYAMDLGGDLLSEETTLVSSLRALLPEP